MTPPATATDPQRPTSRHAVWIVTAIAVAVFWLICTSFRPWDLFDRGGFSADFYDEQARAFLHGRLSVDPSVPGPEGFLIDGRTYLYYGPFLALVRLPFAIFGDLFAGRLVRISMLVAFAVLCLWSARLARAGCAVVRPNLEPRMRRWATVVFMAGVAASPALYAASWISVYNETELWALTLAVVSATLTLEWAGTGFNDRRALVWAGLAALAATMTRAPIGLGVAFALGACGIVLVVRRRRLDRMTSTAIIAGVTPLVVHAMVNFAKFGSWMSVPGDKQLLSIQNEARAAFFSETGGSFFSLRFLPTTLFQYLRPDGIRFERLVPGIRFGPLATNRGSIDVETVTPAASLPSTALLLLVLALIGVLWMVRYRCGPWGLVTIATALGALPTFLIGFIANRYLIDMLPPLIIAGAIGIWVVAERVADRRLARMGVAALAVFGLWANASLAIWTLEFKKPGFTEFRHDIDRSIFGLPSPDVVETRAGAEVPRDGMVGVLDDCSGVYIAEQGRWFALERAPGVRQASGTFAVDDESVLAQGTSWSLRAEPTSPGDGDDTDDRVTIVFERFDGVEGFERTVAVGSDPVTYTVTADPVSEEFAAEIGGTGFFLPRDVLVAGGPVISPTSDGTSTPSQLCRELAP